MISLQALREHVIARSTTARDQWHGLDSTARHAVVAVIFSAIGLLGYSTLSPVGRPSLHKAGQIGARAGSAFMERQSENVIDATAVSIVVLEHQKTGISNNAQGSKIRVDAQKHKPRFLKASHSKTSDQAKPVALKARANVTSRSEKNVPSAAFDPGAVWSVSKMQ